MTIFLPTIPRVIKDLETTEAKVDLAIALYMIILGTVPVFWAAISDRYGRKIPMYLGLGIYIITSVACGFSWNVGSLIAFRVLQALGVSSMLVVGSGVVADTFPPEIRGTALGIFTMAPAVGPLFGPVVGGVITEMLNWRWIFWINAILGAIFLLFITIFLPETLPRSYQPETVETLERDKSWSFWEVLRPFKMLLDPKVFFLSFANGFCQSTTTGILVLFPITLETKFHLNALYTGLCYLPYGILALFGSSSGGKLSDLVARDFGIYSRLFTTLFGVFGYASSLIIFVYAINLDVILIATAFLGFLFCFQRPGVYSFLIQSYPEESSSVSASILFIQYSLGFMTTFMGPLVWNTMRGKYWFFMSLCTLTFLSTIPIIYFLQHLSFFPNKEQEENEDHLNSHRLLGIKTSNRE
eukprot:TRINITY_DN7466_c0_g1_i4.p1 TRINITY_DN7466_c0_g1~~TRINITY_DN7466_c0_g1_i4.p1  ORF type:complete len:413 (-),score=60.81 TRINITY_DN7466_c0_g1_i4:47-1285(-)